MIRDDGVGEGCGYKYHEADTRTPPTINLTRTTEKEFKGRVCRPSQSSVCIYPRYGGVDSMLGGRMLSSLPFSLSSSCRCHRWSSHYRRHLRPHPFPIPIHTIFTHILVLIVFLTEIFVFFIFIVVVVYYSLLSPIYIPWTPPPFAIPPTSSPTTATIP